VHALPDRKLELACLVPTEGEPGTVIPLDKYPGTPYSFGQARTELERSGEMAECHAGQSGDLRSKCIDGQHRKVPPKSRLVNGASLYKEIAPIRQER
jgi:hypothetical protein